jgi:hypothetical protein
MSKNNPIDMESLIKSCIPATTAALQKPTDDTIYGTIECHYCGEIKTAKGARAIIAEVESGRSGESISYGSRFGGRKTYGSGISVRINSGRKYYRRVKTYICTDCIASGADKRESSDDDYKLLLGMFLKFLLIGWGIVFLVKGIHLII